MQLLNGSYALGFNKRHREPTHVFGERYLNGAIRDEPHLFRTARYIVLNPVEVGIRARAEDWPWSSYRAWLGLARWPDILAPTLGEILVGSDLRRRTRELVEESLDGSPARDAAPPDRRPA